jgi:hypothetical protein
MAFRHFVAPFALLWLLAGCVSMPLSSMLQLAAIGRDGLERVDPGQVRVQLSVSQGFEIDVSRARLRLSVTAPSGASRDLELSLELLERSRLERSNGLLRPATPQPTYLLRLTPQSATELTALRQSLAARERGMRHTFSISAPFSSRPAQAKSVTFWADLKLSADGSWIALLDAAELKIKTRT